MVSLIFFADKRHKPDKRHVPESSRCSGNTKRILNKIICEYW